MFTRWFPRGSFRFTVATNTISQLVGRVISVASMAIVSFLIAQQFGPDGYGDFVKITTYAAFFYTLADFGLNAVYVQRSVAADQATTRARLWQTLFGLRLVMGVALMSVAYLLLFFLPGSSDQGYTPLVRFGIVLLTPVLLAQTTTTTANAWFQKMLRYDLATLAQNAGSAVMLITAVALFLLFPIQGAIIGVIALMFGSVVTASVSLYFVRKTKGTVKPIIRWPSMRDDFRRALPLGLTLVFNLIYFHADSVILTLTRSTHEVGIYGLAYKVFELPLVLPIFFMNAVYPLLLQAYSQGKEQSANIFWRSMAFLLVSSIIIAFGLWIAAPLVVFIRPDFAESIVPLRVLLLGLPVFFVSAHLMWVLVAQKKPWQLLAIHTVSMGANVGLNMLLTPSYGYMAAAWITIVTELCILVASVIVVFQNRAWDRRGET